MNYLTVDQFAQKYNVSKQTIRNYCREGKIPGAIKEGRRWKIPDKLIVKNNNRNLLEVLKAEKNKRIKGGIYHKIQIELTYNSNHIEGSKLTEAQTRYIFETNTLGLVDSIINVDDIVETVNHFKCIDFIIDTAKEPLNENSIKKLHELLKSGTSDSNKDWFNVGDYKRLPNEIGNKETTPPDQISKEVKLLIKNYNKKKKKTLEDLIEFHSKFENIHPFQDGNGRVGRLIMFKECLKNNIVPFIISEDLKFFYYRDLENWKSERGFLRDTILTAQDRFKTYLDYFQIVY